MLNVEQYLLIKLMEECAELQQACSKALTFGMLCTPIDPPSNVTNYEQICKELSDVYGTIRVMSDFAILSEIYDEQAVRNKVERLYKYMQVSRDIGILE